MGGPRTSGPPNSPDLNPLDCFVWGVVGRVSNKKPHNSLDSAAGHRGSNYVMAACSRFRPRIEAVIQADGGFIE